MDSNTSSDLNINYINNKGSKLNLENKSGNIVTGGKKTQSSDTSLYLDMLANPTKQTKKTTEVDTDTSILNNDSDDMDTTSVTKRGSDRSVRSNSSSRAQYETFSVRSVDSYESKKGSSKSRGSFSVKANLTPQEIKMRKIELLRKLSELKSKGYQLTKDYSFNSTIEEMEYEYELLRSFADKRNGIKLYKNILVNVSSVIEFMNERYDPFSFKLGGWSEHMSVEVDSYEEVLEEIYEKYKGTGKKMPAELKLFLLIIASASAFHFSKATLANMPGLDKMYQQNPDFVARMINPQKQQSQFMTQQEINLEAQRNAAIERERQNRNRLRQNQMQTQQTHQTQQTQQRPVRHVPTNPPVTKRAAHASETSKNENNDMSYQNAFAPIGGNNTMDIDDKITANIKAPENVEEILKRLHSRADEKSVKLNVETQEETSSDNNRIISDSTMTEDTQGQPVKRKNRKKKSIMTIL
jgi:hypothetical protein